jgi:tetratricopeptide (TPR) repeat protein
MSRATLRQPDRNALDHDQCRSSPVLFKLAVVVALIVLVVMLPFRSSDTNLILGTALAATNEDEQRVKALNVEFVKLYNAGKYQEAEAKGKEALALAEKLLGPNNVNTGTSLNNLALLYWVQGRFADAESLYKRALAIIEKAQGPDHPSTATSLNNLAALYRAQGRYAEAEPLYKRALAIREKALGPDHPDTAGSLNNLALLYWVQGRFAEAELLMKRALAIIETVLGPDHPATASSLNNLAELYRNQGRYAEAEPLYERAMSINNRALGPDHPDTATSLNNLAVLYQDQGRYAEAEPLNKRALAIIERALGPDHPDTATSLNNLALLYLEQGRYVEAEPLFNRALAIFEKALGPDHPSTAKSLNNLAGLYQQQDRYAVAEPLFKRALVITEKALGPDHSSTANSLNNLAVLYQDQGRYAEAEPLFKRALAIREKALGPDHPSTANSLNNLAGLYQDQGRNAVAEPLFKRALTIYEQALGPDHPDTATSLNNLGGVYQDQGRYAETEQLYKRALTIREEALGPEHPYTATSLNNLAFAYSAQGKFASALPLARRGIIGLAQRFNRAESEGSKSELGKTRYQFSSYLRVFFGARRLTGESEAKLNAEAFDAAQWARGSAAGEALQKMAARFAAGSGELSKAVSERETVLARIRFLDKAIVEAVSKPDNLRYAPQQTAWRKETGELTLKLATIDELLKKDFPEFYTLTSPAPVAASDAAGQLGPKEALVVYAIGGDVTGSSYAFVLKADGSLNFLDLKAKGSSIAEDVKALRQSLKLTRTEKDPVDPSRTIERRLATNELTPFDLARANRLYQTVFAPVEASLRGIQNVIVVADGPLESLPFNVLVKSIGAGSGNEAYQKSTWLSDKYVLTTLPSVISLKALRGGKAIAQAPDKFLGVGNPVLTGARSVQGTELILKGGECEDPATLAPLPSTEAELNNMAKALGAAKSSIFMGPNASEKKVYELNASRQLQRARVVAFSTHALASCGKGTFEPAIVLTPSSANPKPANDDGLLTASEITGLSFNADWVILSACNTAAADGTPGAKPLSGLARAFFYAGARSLLVSHWPVGEIASEKLVTSLFNEDNKKLPRAKALSQAMKTVRADPTYAHPAFWAPFTIVGEGR